jgi:hypothetical protein
MERAVTGREFTHDTLIILNILQKECLYIGLFDAVLNKIKPLTSTVSHKFNNIFLEA